ncbi:MAG: phytoene desaturase family protein [Saprospiraceae bacterium]
MLQSYKKKYTVKPHYDTIIIGSGMGSLTTAAILAKDGKSVLVLERHYTAGGFTHVFKRKGFEWDVGIHYIGEVQRENSTIRKVFDYISDNQLKWADMGEVYDKVIIGDKTYDYVKGVSNFKAKMAEYFPKEKEAIKQYVNLVFEANKASRTFFMDKALPNLMSSIAGGFMRRAYNKLSDQTTYEVLRKLTNNEELIKALTGQYGDYGLPPKQSSFVMHAAVARHYFSGGSFPIGGSSQIFETVLPVIEKAGGTVLISAEVNEIVIENNRATGVKMNDGNIFTADNIISGAGIITTYGKLLPKETVEKHRLKEQLQKINPSVASGCLYLGLEGSPEELNLPKSNYWIYPGDADHDTCINRYLKDINEEFPLVYISFPSAKDPDWSNRYPERSTIDIITLLPYETFEKWEGTRWMKRGEEYDNLKENISNRLLEILYKHLPYLRGKIVHQELSSPLSTKHFINYDKGEIYGLDHTPSRFRQKFLRPRTPIKNLYLTGQDIVTAGVGGALFSGVLTVAAMTGKNVLEKIMK